MMLDDLSWAAIVRPVYCILGSDFFTSSDKSGAPSVFDLRRIQRLVQYSGVWKYMFAAKDASDHLVYDRLVELRVPFSLLISRETMTDADCRKAIQAADVVFAPSFCKGLEVYPTLSPSSSPEKLLEVLEYFATTGAPFSVEEYKRILA